MSSAAAPLRIGLPRGAYAEREVAEPSWLDALGARAAGVVLRRVRTRRGAGERIVQQAGTFETAYIEASDDLLRENLLRLRGSLRRDGLIDGVVAETFALVREIARREIGKRPHDVQLLGGWTMLKGMIAEMETGEGKTLTAVLPACTMALAGLPVHVISVNDYLVGRDAETMGPIYRALGIRVGAIQHGMGPDERRAAYGCDVTYVSNKEIAFDYLKDRITLGRVRSRSHLLLERLHDDGCRTDDLLLRGLCFAIVDEADSVLVDEARTPLIISGRDERDEIEEQIYETALSIAQGLEPETDFRIHARERAVSLTRTGEDRVSAATRELGGIWTGPRRAESFVAQALAALHVFERDRHYIVVEGKVQIVDEYTGRTMPDRSWERGLHQMIECKEECELTRQIEPLAKISYQRFFRRYQRLAGMTGTAQEVRTELWSVYGLAVMRIPTHRPLRRSDLGHEVFDREDDKWDAVVARIAELHEQGRPVLVGTSSVYSSELLSDRLTGLGLSHQVLNARQDAEEAKIVALAGEAGRITVATNMAGRGTDIVPTDEVRGRGGLHVLATERHDAGRIDRQLFGRAGRQGDPGSFESITSLEDPLVQAHGGAWDPADWLRTGLFDRRLRRRLMRSCQKRAERLHAAQRRQLFKSDDRVSSMLAFSGRSE